MTNDQSLRIAAKLSPALPALLLFVFLAPHSMWD